ncbi:MAG: FtsX-like permease family protein [Nitrospirae bacterium]|nr:MAG: FtsX-like permease family protein [Nitrospirota bacterium]
MSSLALSLRLAWRETKASWRRFVFFFLCVAIGVGTVVGVGLFAANVEHTILREARSLLGGDIEIRSSRLLTPAGRQVLEDLRARGVVVSHVRELVAMAAAFHRDDRPASSTRSVQLVELKVVDHLYPLYGKVEVEPSLPLDTLLIPPDCPASPCWGAVVQQSLLIRLGLTVGDYLTIGRAPFLITGLLRKEPDRVASAFSLGPRVLIAQEALAATELVKPGSRIRERYVLRVPASMSIGPLLGELQGRLGKEGVRISDYREAQPRIRRFLDQLATYLGLIGLTALFVGGIGVACTIQGFVAQKSQTIAILKTLGAPASMILRTYLVQSLWLGGLGSLLGLCLGIMLQWVFPLLFADLFPITMTPRLEIQPLFHGLGLGVLSTVLFALWPILGIRAIPPAWVFRREVDQSQRQDNQDSVWIQCLSRLRAMLRDPLQLLVGGIMGAGLSALAIWQAGSLWLGMLFLAAFLVALLVLQGAAAMLLALLGSWRPPRQFAIRHALASLRRPGNYTAGMTVSLGIGVMVMVTISLIETALLRAIEDHLPADAPSFFFIDIQPDQVHTFKHLVQTTTRSAEPELIPVARARLAAIDGRPVDPQRYTRSRYGWYFTREYVLTALPELPKGNTLDKGQWWGIHQRSSEPGLTSSSTPIGVSVEVEAARHLGVDIGSTLTFDIQGMLVTAHVQSLRTVDWSSFRTNFFMILSPNAFQAVPITYIASAKVDAREEVPLQQALVRALPNVTAIQVGDVLANVARLLDQLAWAIQGVATLCVLSGLMVMVAALSTTRYRRLYEAAILKTLGGTRRTILTSFVMEFLIVGTIAGLIGIGLASPLSWIVVEYFLDISWTAVPQVLGGGLLATAMLTVLVGCLGTFRLLGEPPLAVLRQE